MKEKIEFFHRLDTMTFCNGDSFYGKTRGWWTVTEHHAAINVI